jgi:hypothetical protein
MLEHVQRRPSQVFSGDGSPQRGLVDKPTASGIDEV